MAAERRGFCGAAVAGAGAGVPGVGGSERAERAAADGFSAALRGGAGVERDWAGDGVERGHREGASFAGDYESTRVVGGRAMRFGVRFGDRRGEPAERGGQAEPGAGETGDLALEQALKDFRMSVCAWSEAAYSRPRTAARVVRRRSWRLA